MKTLLLAILTMSGTTAAYAENHSKSFPKSNCNELFMGIADLLEEADKEWAFKAYLRGYIWPAWWGKYNVWCVLEEIGKLSSRSGIWLPVGPAFVLCHAL